MTSVPLPVPSTHEEMPDEEAKKLREIALVGARAARRGVDDEKGRVKILAKPPMEPGGKPP
jgi:hypothetical protein